MDWTGCLFYCQLSWKTANSKQWKPVRIAVEKHRNIFRMWSSDSSPAVITFEFFDSKKSPTISIQLGGGVSLEDFTEGTYQKHCFSIQDVGQKEKHIFSFRNQSQKNHWMHLLKDKLDLEKDTSNGLMIPKTLVILKNSLLSLDGLQVEFIFRVPGTDETTLKIEKSLARNCAPKVSTKEIHSVSATIKKWFKFKPDYLLGTFSIQQIAEYQKQKISLIDFLSKMDEPNKSLFLWLLDLCTSVVRSQVAEFTEPNKTMNAKSMARLFAPIVFDIPMHDPVEGAKNTTFVSNLLESFIDSRIRSLGPLL